MKWRDDEGGVNWPGYVDGLFFRDRWGLGLMLDFEHETPAIWVQVGPFVGRLIFYWPRRI